MRAPSSSGLVQPWVDGWPLLLDNPQRLCRFDGTLSRENKRRTAYRVDSERYSLL